MIHVGLIGADQFRADGMSTGKLHYSIVFAHTESPSLFLRADPSDSIRQPRHQDRLIRFHQIVPLTNAVGLVAGLRVSKKKKEKHDCSTASSYRIS